MLDTPKGDGGGGMSDHSRRRYTFLVSAAWVIALDQLTKTLVRSLMARGEVWPSEDWPIRLNHVTNTGAAFGVLEDQTAFLIVMAFVGIGAIYLYYRHPPFDHWLASLATGLMLGGAAGNLIDRVRFERVTDFIDVGSFPSFNVADSAITIGVAVIILGYLWAESRRREETSHSADQEEASASDADG